MGSTKKHKKDRESSKKHKRRTRSRSPLATPPPPSLSSSSVNKDVRDHRERERDRDKDVRERDRERDRSRERRHHKRYREHKEHRDRNDRQLPSSRERPRRTGHNSPRDDLNDYESDSSDCVEVPLSPPPAPPAPKISKSTATKSAPRAKSSSPIPENGAGDCLSIQETNKLRAKLGLKPLEMDNAPSTSSAAKKDSAGNALRKDEWGEFYHKPADNIAEKLQAEKLREKFKQNKEKRMLEAKMKKVRALGEDDEFDDISEWVDRNREKARMKKEAEKRSKMLEEMDEAFGVSELVNRDIGQSNKKMYTAKNIKGLRVEHDYGAFGEGKTVILTLKDNDVLAEDDDTLVNVNMIDDERYRRNIDNKKKNPHQYGYNVYDEEVDEFGMPLGRGVLNKYDEEIEGVSRKHFTIGEAAEEEQYVKRRLQEVKAKLSGKKLESLNESILKLASDTYTESEMASFKKPKKKKVRKLRQKVEAKDLLPLDGDAARDHGRRVSGRHISNVMETDDDIDMKGIQTDVKVEEEDDDLEQILSKARRLKQTEALITKALPTELATVEPEIKTENDSDEEAFLNGTTTSKDFITLNQTAEFCRTLGDIPTYGMSGNRDLDARDMMDFDSDSEDANEAMNEEPSTGTWNSVNPDLERPSLDEPIEITEVAILDEEPDVGLGVGAALKLALSKGYLEKEESNRPSNTRMAHLQAKNYSIEDKAHEHDDKFSRRDRFHSGPISDFKEKDNYKPNVKLEYIDDGGRLLNEKEAFRYLSHKFHGKGPGKNKIEKRLKKNEQDGLMRKMSSTDTPLGTLTMLQHKQKETHSPYIVLSGSKQMQGATVITKQK